MSKTIYISVDEVFAEAKQRSQLRARSLEGKAAQLAIITDTDDKSLRIFLKHGVVDLANRIGELGDLTATEGTITHKLDDNQTEQGFDKAAQLLEQSVVFYLLFEWCRSVGIGELAGEYYGLYEKAARDYRTNSSGPGIVKPKYRPYF